MKLSEILSPHLSGLLAGVGIHTVDDVLENSTTGLETIDGIGPKTAEEIWAKCALYNDGLCEGTEEKAPGTGPAVAVPIVDEPTIDQAAEAAEVDQDALAVVVPVIAAGLAPRLYHPNARLRDEWELAKDAVRISKAILAELKKA